MFINFSKLLTYLLTYNLSSRIWRSEVRFLMGTQNYFFAPRSWQDEKTYFSIIQPTGITSDTN